ncbi:MAG TPA: LamG-like jellyroll fold domain-containing protein [Terriglobales bacterium]|nr:LamG-like jellyroll fold domain-containing protein [Terriglobales bacterium]
MKFGILACFGRSRIGRGIVSALVAALVFIMVGGRAEAGPATTVVSDVVYRADGAPAAGQILLSWPAFVTADGKPVAAGTMSLGIGAGGNVTVALAPNEGANPSGTYYKVTLKLNDGTTSTEYWTIPRKSPVKVAEVRSQLAPASVAVQFASRQYVDSTLALKADGASVLHKIGDEQVAGIKEFVASPLVPMPRVASAVANKSYVDAQVASVSTGEFVRKSGDTMTGALILAGDPTSTNHAVNRHYIDLQMAGLAGALTQKLGRENDTPITLAGMRFATQFPSIQAAINDAGATGSVVIPREYPGIDSFANPNKVPIIDLRGDASYRGVYNVKDFGAKPNDGADDWQAIQAAIDAASEGNGPYGSVYVPRGIFHVSKPLHITKGIRFFGAGRGQSEITGYSADQGAVLVVSPPTSLYPSLPTGESLVTGPGNSMYLNGGYDYLLNLRESGAVELNGRDALTVEFYYKPDESVSAGLYNIISSSGTVTTTTNVAFSIQHVTGDSITASLNVGGVLQSVTSPANAVTQGSVAHIAMTFDGSSLRLFINGELKGSTAASGTISQAAGEDFVIGPRVAGFMESTFLNPMAKGWIDSVRISNFARYSGNFASPTAKFTSDASTLFLLNFDSQFDQFTTASTWLGPEHLFLRRFGGGMGQVGNLHLSDLSFVGTGPEFIYVISSLIENVQVSSARRGLQFLNNCYLNRLTSVRVTAQSTAQFALGIGAASGVLTMTDLALTGGKYPLYIDTSSATIHGLWVEASNGTEIGAVLKGNANTSFVIDQPVFSNETNPVTVQYTLAEVNVGNLVMNGGVLETSNGAPHVGVFGGGSLVHVAGNYSLVGTPPQWVYHVVSSPTNPIQITGASQQHMSIPFASNMNAVQTTSVRTNQTCSGTDKVSGISSGGTLICSPDQGAGTGYTLTLSSTGSNELESGGTYYFGGDLVGGNNTSFDLAKIEIPKGGILNPFYVRQNLSVAASSAAMVAHRVCINSEANCVGGTSFSYNSTATAGTDISLNQAVAAGDTIAVRVDTPNWDTRPANVHWYAVAYIE